MRRRLIYILIISTLVSLRSAAQSITGYSVMEESSKPCPGTIGSVSPQQDHELPNIYLPPRVPHCTVPIAEAYVDTEEDYAASLYYNVETYTAVFAPNGSEYQPVRIQGNPKATGQLTADDTVPGATSDGIFSEVTNHYLDFFYIVGGNYYDPYGYSGYTTGSVDGSWDSGYWLYVNVALYIQQASVLLGQTISAMNHNTANSGTHAGTARAFSALYQVYIPDEWINGPSTNITCLNPGKIYQGDFRGVNPHLGSYRAFQQITLGVGGLTLPSQPGAQDTGYTHRFAPDSLDAQSVHLTQAALQDVVTGDCHYLEAVGKAPTSTMRFPTSTYNGATATTNFVGDAGNPLEPAPAISWNASVSVTESDPLTLKVFGTVTHDCYPSHELSIGQNVVYSFPAPLKSSVTTVGLCLSGVGSISRAISGSYAVTPY